MLALKRGCNPDESQMVIIKSTEEQPLTKKYRNHALVSSKNYKSMREHHIEPDWLLIYEVYYDTLILKLIRTESHSNLFNFKTLKIRKANPLSLEQQLI